MKFKVEYVLIKDEYYKSYNNGNHVKVEAIETFNYKGFEFFLSRNEKGRIYATERISGMEITGSGTKEKTIARLNDIEEHVLVSTIYSAIEESGFVPAYERVVSIIE